MDDANDIINQFYDEHYANVKQDSEFKTEEVKKEEPPENKEDVQVTFKEALE